MIQNKNNEEGEGNLKGSPENSVQMVTACAEERGWLRSKADERNSRAGEEAERKAKEEADGEQTCRGEEVYDRALSEQHGGECRRTTISYKCRTNIAYLLLQMFSTRLALVEALLITAHIVLFLQETAT